MPDAVAGTATAFFLYDVGDAIALDDVRALIETSAPAQLTKVTASNIQYQQPPVVIDGATLGTSADDFRCRIRGLPCSSRGAPCTTPRRPPRPRSGSAGRLWIE